MDYGISQTLRIAPCEEAAHDKQNGRETQGRKPKKSAAEAID